MIYREEAMTKQWDNTSTCKHANVVKGVCQGCGLIFKATYDSSPEEADNANDREMDNLLDECDDIEDN